VPVKRLPAPPVEPVSTPTVNPSADRTSPFATVKEASAYLKESKRTVREMVARGVFKLAPNSNGAVKPWRLLWSEIERHAANQIRKAA
jgi:Helix-turn-helix domain